jgi:hypothetical protein
MNMTHKGQLKGADSRTKKGHGQEILLRETQLYWVTIHGKKYRKSDGFPAGNQDYHLFLLDINEVKRRH